MVNNIIEKDVISLYLSGKSMRKIANEYGTNQLTNLQFLSWFENRCKNDISQNQWNLIKSNITEFFI